MFLQLLRFQYRCEGGQMKASEYIHAFYFAAWTPQVSDLLEKTTSVE